MLQALKIKIIVKLDVKYWNYQLTLFHTVIEHEK